MKSVELTERALVRIAGTDAESLLQDVISCDVEGLPAGTARIGALLTPQGKIFFEFLTSRHGEDGFLFDLAADQVQPFIQRMTMYRLRAKVQIQPFDVGSIHACWDGDVDGDMLIDERFSAVRPVYRAYGGNRESTASREDYDRLRIEAGVAEAGHDYASSDAFPHDVLMDLNHGVSMSKGCFVGQEVVSRMKHRGTARRRVTRVDAEAPLPGAGTPLEAGGKTIGQLGTTVGNSALALVRTDRAAKAMDTDTPIYAGDLAVTLTLPAWTGLHFPLAETEGQSDRL